MNQYLRMEDKVDPNKEEEVLDHNDDGEAGDADVVLVVLEGHREWVLVIPWLQHDV